MTDNPITNLPLISKFWTTLFDEGDITCLARNKFGTQLFNVKAADPSHPIYRELQYFSICPMKGDGRADDNVTKYRNFLIEFDNIPLEEQIKGVKKVGMPWSTMTFSGSKSFHFIISLETPLVDRDVYDFVVEWIYNILTPYGVDTQTKNPSRLSRVPGGTNEKEMPIFDEEGKKVLENGKPKLRLMYAEQKLMKVQGRIKNEDLENWLLAHPECRPSPAVYDRTVVLSDHADPTMLSSWTRHLLENGIHNGKRNAEVFKMGFDFIRCGFSLEEALAYYQNNSHQSDFSMSEVETAITSAYKTHQRRMP